MHFDAFLTIDFFRRIKDHFIKCVKVTYTLKHLTISSKNPEIRISETWRGHTHVKAFQMNSTNLQRKPNDALEQENHSVFIS